MKKHLRLLDKIHFKRKPSAVSNQLSDMARPVRAVSRLNPKAYQLSAIGIQPSDISRWLPSKSKLIPKAYHLIPLLILVFVSCVAVLAQEPVGHTAPAAKAENKAIDLSTLGVQIGEKVPDVAINNIHNYKSSTAKLSDFRGKLLILDFWATWCAPCVAMIPKMDSLQREFGDKIQFLSVTYQKEVEVLPFLENLERRNGRRYDLPIIVGDSLLKKEFPHKYLPHYVWIDGDGILTGITSFEEVNRDNITKLFMGKSLDLKEKKNVVIANDDWGQPLLTTDSNFDGFLSYSAVTAFQSGFGSSDYNTEPIVSDSLIRITARNLTIPQLYQVALGRGRPIDWKHTLLDVKEPDKLIQFDKSGNDYLSSLEDGRGFCYEIVVPRSFGKRVYGMMENDLRGVFPYYEANIESLQTHSLVLRKTIDFTIASLKSEGGDPSLFVDNTGIEMRNSSLNALIARLNELNRPFSGGRRANIFFFNETGFTVPVDLRIDADIMDIEALNAKLKKYGLLLEEEVRSVSMLVIRDKR